MAADRDPISEAHSQWLRHGWTGAADGMAMVTSVVRVKQLLMERIDAVLRPLDLSFAGYEVLRLLSFTQSGSMPMSRLGSLLQVHPTTVTSAVDRLVRQGHVERLRRVSDRRVILASLTEPGRAVVSAATTELNATVFESPGLPPQELALLIELLGMIRSDAGDHVARPVVTRT